MDSEALGKCLERVEGMGGMERSRWIKGLRCCFFIVFIFCIFFFFFVVLGVLFVHFWSSRFFVCEDIYETNIRKFL